MGGPFTFSEELREAVTSSKCAALDSCGQSAASAEISEMKLTGCFDVL